MVKPPCAYCGKTVDQAWAHINRAIKNGSSIYCNRECAGLGRRSGKTIEQKKEEKRLYDMNYRRSNSESIKTKKSTYYQRTKNPEKEAEKRKTRMPKHVEYCRRPEYKAWKKGYDQQYRAKKFYGEFGEAHVALIHLNEEVSKRIDRIDIYTTNGTLNKKQTRRREYERVNS